MPADWDLLIISQDPLALGAVRTQSSAPKSSHLPMRQETTRSPAKSQGAPHCYYNQCHEGLPQLTSCLTTTEFFAAHAAEASCQGGREEDNEATVGGFTGGLLCAQGGVEEHTKGLVGMKNGNVIGVELLFDPTRWSHLVLGSRNLNSLYPIPRTANCLQPPLHWG